MDRDEADEILITHSLWSEDEAEYASGTGTEEASEEEDEDELRRKISMMNQMMMPMTTAYVAIKNRYH